MNDNEKKLESSAKEQENSVVASGEELVKEIAAEAIDNVEDVAETVEEVSADSVEIAEEVSTELIANVEDAAETVEAVSADSAEIAEEVSTELIANVEEIAETVEEVSADSVEIAEEVSTELIANVEGVAEAVEEVSADSVEIAEEVSTELIANVEDVAEAVEAVSADSVEIAEEVGGIVPPLQPPTDITDEEPKEPKKKGIALIILAVVLVVGALITIMVINSKKGAERPQRAEDGSLLLEAVFEDSFPTTGQFQIVGLDDYNQEEIQEGLSLEPEVDFTVAKTGKTVMVTVTGYRNIGYAGSFDYIDEEGVPRREVFRVNGRPLSINLTQKEVERYSAIELVFSEQVDIASLQEHMSITPKTEYEINYDLNRVTIRPTEQWALTSQYRISIDANYASKNGKEFTYNQALSFHIVRPESEGGGRYYPEVIFHNDDNFIITEDVDMAVSFSGESLEKDVPVIIETYRLGDVEKFKAQAEVYLDYSVDLDALDKVDTNAFTVKNGDNKFKLTNPGYGSYVVSTKFDDPNIPGKEIQVRTGYLVTPYSLYMQSSKGETLAWLHSGETHSPSEGYKIVFDEKEERSGVTDKDGIVVVENRLQDPTEESDEEYYYYSNTRDTQITQISIYDQNDKLVYYDDASVREASRQRSNIFYSYLFLDRSIYRPTDTIHFWGFVRPFRSFEGDMPKTVDVIFDADGMDLTIKADVNSEGVYTGEIKLEDIRSSQYTISAVIMLPPNPELDEKEPTEYNLDYQYVSVKEFEKPTYVIETAQDKEYYEFNDTVELTISPTFYDGTPLPNFELEFYAQEPYSGDWGSPRKLTTNSDGVVKVSFPVSKAPDYYRQWVGLASNYYRVQIASDGENISKVESYEAMTTDQIVSQKITKQADGKNISLELEAFKLDLNTPAFKKAYEEAKTSKKYYEKYQLFSTQKLAELAKGEPIDLPVDVELRWNYTDKNSTHHANRQSNPREEYYLFDNNYSFDFTTIPKEDLEVIKDWETMEKKVSVITENGKAVINDIIFLPEGREINFDEKVNCRSTVSYNSSTNKRNEYSYYYPESAEGDDWGYYYGDEQEEAIGFTFEITEIESGENKTPEFSYYRRASLSVDTPANFKLMLDGEPVTKNGTILYTIIQGGLYQHKLVNANEFDLTYLIEYGPNVQMTAAYFDGVRSHFINDLDLVAESESLSVNLEITSDQDSYRPGDIAKIGIKATDHKGVPVEGNLVVAVVDEAIFAVEEQYLSVMWDLNSSLYYLDNYVAKYCTTYRGGGANSGLWSGGKGDAGGGTFYDSYRSNFKDTATFVSTRTDKNGNGSIEFELPDNTTSWRITAVEIGDKLIAGSEKYNIISTLPFFVKPVTSYKYLDGDEISMLVQGHGVVLNEGDDIKYTVNLTGDGFDKTLTSAGKSYQPWEFNFGKLPIGTYTLKAQAEYSGYSDTVELPISVIKSNLELVVNTPFEIHLNQPLDISAVRFPVTLSLYSERNMPFFETVNSMLCHYCSAVNQRMARFTAKRVLRESLLEDEIPYYIQRGNESIADLQQPDGGIAENNTDEAKSEVILTSYMAMLASDQFDTGAMSSFLEEAKNTVKDEKELAAAYLGLAALKGVEVDVILDQLGIDKGGKVLKEKDLRLDVKAYYVTALAYLEEDALASKLYKEQLKPHLSDIASHAKIRYYYRITGKELVWERNTAAVWIAASMLDAGDADTIATHFGGHSWRYRTLFEGMIYLTNYKQEIVQPNFSYTLDGEKINAKVGRTGMASLVLNRSQLDNLRFTALDKDLKVYAYYVGEPSEVNIEQSENISVSKTITAVDANTYEVTIKLELTNDAPTGYYDISDWIPSNSRLYKPYVAKNYTNGYSRMTTENQKVYVTYYHRYAGARTETITYRIRQTFTAEAMSDRVYVIHGDSGENCSSEPWVFQPENTKLNNPVVHVDPSKNRTS